MEKYRETLSVSEVEDIAVEITRDFTTESEESSIDDYEEEAAAETKVKSGTPSTRVAPSQRKSPKSYRNFLMMSEWMIDAPSDFPVKWLLTVCPIGKRVTVVSSHGQTKCYARNGSPFLRQSFPSSLPGGGRGFFKGNSILDCIYVDREQTFYVLDLILWNGVSFFGCDTDFRFYWLKTKLEDEVTVSPSFSGRKSNSLQFSANKSIGNKFTFQFKLLKRSEASKDSIVQAVQDFDKDFNSSTQVDAARIGGEKRTVLEVNAMQGNQEKVMEDLYFRSPSQDSSPDKRRVEIDGLLFFHRQGLYASGTTPLVLWLKTSMLPDVLGVTVTDHNVSHRMEVQNSSHHESKGNKKGHKTSRLFHS